MLTSCVCTVTLLPLPRHSLTYFIIQGPAFAYDCGEGTKCGHEGTQHWFALMGLLTCIACFIGYMYYQVKTQDSSERHDVLVEKLHQAISDGDISIVGAFADLINSSVSSAASSQYLNGEEVRKELRETLRFFYDRYDTSKDGFIDERQAHLCRPPHSAPVLFPSPLR